MRGQEEQPGSEPSDRRDADGPRPVGPDVTTGWYALLGIGFEFLAAICLMGAIGWWLDNRLRMFPWLTIIGGAVGFGAGLMILIRAANRAFKD